MSSITEIERGACCSYISGICSYAIELICCSAESEEIQGKIWDARHIAGLRCMQKHINSETEMCRLIDKIHGVLSLCKLYAPQDSSDRSLVTDNGVNLLAQVYAAIIACNADENSETIQNECIAIYNS